VIGLGTLPDADAEAALAPAKARAAARPPAAPRAQPKAPQPDLVEAPARPVRATRVVRPDDGAGDTLVRTRDRARLKVLLGELESLRRVMMAEPDR
jgi:hypothetical protein